MHTERIGRLPTIPEYYKQHINANVDLIANPKQPCPFHHETAPSFSFSEERGVWSCFGGCKCYGKDVVHLHLMNYKLSSRKEAEESLNAMYGIVKKIKPIEKHDFTITVNEDKVMSEQLYQEALILVGDDIDRWLELDYFMSKTPIEMTDLKYILDKWKGEST